MCCLKKLAIFSSKFAFCLLLFIVETQPVMAWTETQYTVGSLAVNVNNPGQFGIGYNAVDHFSAGNTALAECGQGCEIVLDFYECAAYVADSKISSWAAANTLPDATDKALSACVAKGGKHCELQVYACNNDVNLIEH
jgi:hypothetical protein